MLGDRDCYLFGDGLDGEEIESFELNEPEATDDFFPKADFSTDFKGVFEFVGIFLRDDVIFLEDLCVDFFWIFLAASFYSFSWSISFSI